MEKAAAVFKALGEPTRLRIATLLAANGETCVCHLAEALGEADFKISRHLGVLRGAGIVEARREGTWMHYRLAEKSGGIFENLLECIRGRLGETPSARTDLERLSEACCESKK